MGPQLISSLELTAEPKPLVTHVMQVSGLV